MFLHGQCALLFCGLLRSETINFITQKDCFHSDRRKEQHCWMQASEAGLMVFVLIMSVGVKLWKNAMTFRAV